MFICEWNIKESLKHNQKQKALELRSKLNKFAEFITQNDGPNDDIKGLFQI